MRRPLCGLAVIVLATLAAPAQVRVKAHTNRVEYLVGEPIIVVVHATNIGDEPIGYDQCCEGSDNGITLAVPNGRRKAPPDLGACNSGSGGFSGGGIDHPPVFAPGEIVSFRYLLKDYRLKSGTYTVWAKGDAPVRWFFGAGRNHSAVSDRKGSDVVEGKHFEVGLPITLIEGTPEELQQRFQPYVEASREGFGMTRPSREAREAIAEMAPPFLEKTILEFANQPESAQLAVKGLAQIPTTSSREALVALYDRSQDLRLRVEIVRHLAGVATSAELPFFASLLPGRSTPLDDQARFGAVLGIGRLGGPAAAAALDTTSPNPEVRNALVEALGNSRTEAAIPILLHHYADESLNASVVTALATLTHRRWEVVGQAPAAAQTYLLAWWRRHAGKIRIYGRDRCPANDAILPLDP
ncbi:MAG: HEAT repeat domain-containing protein [Bryobacteraceae bacterium]